MTAANIMNEGSSTNSVECPILFTTRIVKRSGSSFYWAMRMLDAPRRGAMYAIYAFCRTVDDIADGPDSPEQKAARLAAWRAEISRVFKGVAETPAGRALEGAVALYGLDINDFMSVIDGMETDIPDAVRIADQAELSQYIDRVACAVGRLSTPVFGLSPTAGLPLAHALGEALQITNILRDLDEDAVRNRMYLPLDSLKASGLPTDIAEGHALDICSHPACAGLCDVLAARALSRFDEVGEMLSGMDSHAARAPRLMMVAYRRLLEKIIRTGWRLPRQRVSLSWHEKLWFVVRHGWL